MRPINIYASGPIFWVFAGIGLTIILLQAIPMGIILYAWIKAMREIKNVNKTIPMADVPSIRSGGCGIRSVADGSICDGRLPDAGKHSCEGDCCERSAGVPTDRAYDGLPGHPNESI